MRNFLNEIRDRVLVFDGSKGFMLQEMGLKSGECPELWNTACADKVKKIYRLYKEAGADVIQTNTFQGSRAVLKKYGLEGRTYELNRTAAEMAREVMGDDGYVAASVGPLGELLEPLGGMSFETAYGIFVEQMKALMDGGVDIINLETFTDLAEMRVALLAAKENFRLPVVCSMAFGRSGRTIMGNTPYVCACVLKSMGADMVGANCSEGPEHILDVIREMSRAGDIYLSVKPNAGIPELVEGRVVFSERPEKFAAMVQPFVESGARLIGGCCGTTPEFVSAIRQVVDVVEPAEIPKTHKKEIASGSKCIDADRIDRDKIYEIDIGQSSPVYKELNEGGTGRLTDEAMRAAFGSYQAVLVWIDRFDDMEIPAKIIDTLQLYIREPLIIGTTYTDVLSHALRRYAGKAGVLTDGFSGRAREEADSIIRKYGGHPIKSVARENI